MAPTASVLRVPNGGEHSANRVLLVESSRAVAAAVAGHLEAVDGIACEVADTLAGAKRLVAKDLGRFFVAVVCLRLPDAQDGEIVDVLQQAGLRVIVLTGQVDENWRTQMFARGVADYVVKEGVLGIEYIARTVSRMYRNRDTRVLVVDDTQAFRDYASGLLQQHGYRTLTAKDGREGLDMLVAHPEVGLVVTDYLMPRLDGIGMVQEMRKLRSIDDLAIIALSQSAEPGVLARFLKSGANDFLHKPFGVEEFYCRIDQNVDMLHAVLDARRLASRDFLTGMYNRRHFFEHAAGWHVRALAGEIDMVFAMIDIDHFKRINDSFGHLVGDQALVAVARCLDERIGGSGIVARFGGEEFVYLGIVDDSVDTLQRLEGLRAAIAAIALEFAGQPVSLTVSIGATLAPGRDLDQMLASADAAVYEAKQQGRNRVVIR